MQFNIDEFFDRLQEQKLSKQEASLAIHREIRDAENQKVAFVDLASENPEFFKFIINEIDSYTIYLKVLHNWIDPQAHKAAEELSYDTEKAAMYQTMKLIMQLKQLEIRKRINRRGV